MMRRLAHTLGFVGALLFWAGPMTAFWFDWSLPLDPTQLSGSGLAIMLCAAAALRWLVEQPAGGDGSLGE